MGVTGLAAAAVVGAVAGAATTKKPNLGKPAPPPPPPQAAKAPGAGDVRMGLAGAGQAGGSPGIAGTFLTGAGGVDPGGVNLRKASLLGG